MCTRCIRKRPVWHKTVPVRDETLFAPEVSISPLIRSIVPIYRYFADRFDEIRN